MKIVFYLMADWRVLPFCVWGWCHWDQLISERYCAFLLIFELHYTYIHSPKYIYRWYFRVFTQGQLDEKATRSSQETEISVGESKFWVCSHMPHVYPLSCYNCIYIFFSLLLWYEHVIDYDDQSTFKIQKNPNNYFVAHLHV